MSASLPLIPESGRKADIGGRRKSACQEATYAPQQTAPYSITSSARARVRLGAGGLTRLKRNTGTAVVHIDDVVDNLPFIVRRDHRIVAAFAKKRHANVRKGPDCKTRDTNGGGMLAPP